MGMDTVLAAADALRSYLGSIEKAAIKRVAVEMFQAANRLSNGEEPEASNVARRLANLLSIVAGR